LKRKKKSAEVELKEQKRYMKLTLPSSVEKRNPKLKRNLINRKERSKKTSRRCKKNVAQPKRKRLKSRKIRRRLRNVKSIRRSQIPKTRIIRSFLMVRKGV